MWTKENLKHDAAFRDVNMTPLIDVSLVLVVILLLATPLAFESAISVRNTATRGSKAERKVEEKHVELDVISDDIVKINRAPVSFSDLTQTLRPLLNANGSTRVVITCDDRVSHGAFVSVLDKAKVSGAAEIAVMGK